MKINAIVGNPPYQVMDGGGTGASSIPVFQYFVGVAKKMQPNYISMIIPARWYAGGRGLDSFRQEMLDDPRIVHLFDFPHEKDCFPSANISGGICYFLRDTNFIGQASFTSKQDGKTSTTKRTLNEFEVLIRYNDAISIIHKTKKDISFMNNVASRNFFDLNSAVRGAVSKMSGNIVVLSSRGRGYINSEMVSSNKNEIYRFQTVMGKVISGHLGETDKDGKVKVISTIDILYPGEVTTDSYLVVGSFDTLEQSQNTAKYLLTKTLRFLLLQALTSMNISKGSFKFVPAQNFTPNSDIDWSQSIADIDRQLYAKYGLTEDEIAFIESMIKPM